MRGLAQAEAALLAGDLSLDGFAEASARGRWLRAVGLGAQGRYAEAWDLLAPALCGYDDDVSLCLSAAGSFHRQLGRHRVAAILDEYALSVAASGEARLDALIGLAADAVGIGDVALACARLERAAAVDGGWRGAIRLEWVRAEVALMQGDVSGGALPAQRAVDESREHGATRHLAKSLLFAAVTTGAAAAAHESLELSESIGALSLLWPARAILIGLEPDNAHQHARAAQQVILQIASATPAEISTPWLSAADVQGILTHAG